jgi:hypothetical protein
MNRQCTSWHELNNATGESTLSVSYSGGVQRRRMRARVGSGEREWAASSAARQWRTTASSAGRRWRTTASSVGRRWRTTESSVGRQWATASSAGRRRRQRLLGGGERMWAAVARRRRARVGIGCHLPGGGLACSRLVGDAPSPSELGGGLAWWAAPSPARVVGDALAC